MFDSPLQLGLGLVTGIVFGFVLQKAQVTKFNVIVGQLLLRDFTMVKVMLTAIAVGGAGVYALHEIDLADLHIKDNVIGGVIVGGLLLGAGMAVLGYCPGTAVAALAQGSRDAGIGLLGMLAGAAAYAEAYPLLVGNLLSTNYGKQTLPELTNISPWAWLAMILIASMSLFISTDIDPWTSAAKRLIPRKKSTST